MLQGVSAWFLQVLQNKPFLTHSKWRNSLMLLAGGAMVFAYAPFQQGWLVPLLLAFWLLGLVRSQTAKEATLTSYCFGVGWFVTGVSWVFVSIDQFGGLPLIFSILLMLLLCLYLALFPALAGWLWFRSRKFASGYSLLLLPIIWLITEFLRGWFLTGFPWLSLGYSQTTLTLGNLAPYIGEIGISLLLMVIAISLALTILRKRLEWLFVPVIIFSLAWFAPRFSTIQPSGETITVALVQGNVEQELKWNPEQQWPNLQTYLALTEGYYDHDLIVWPESAITYIEPHAQQQLAALDQRLLAEETTLISGIIDLDRRTNDFYNSMIVMGEQSGGSWFYRHDNRYRKHHLLPIGEFVPFESILRPIAPLFNLPMSSFSRGESIQPNLDANGFTIAANICFEVAFSRQIRANFQTDTQLLLTISNDSWFGDSHGPHQHLEIARMRARELGRPMLRATNNGITGVFDEQGNTVVRLPQFTADVASTRVVLVEGTTLFARFGELPAWLLAILVALPGLRWQKGVKARQKT
ncbi:apolipoprotein N-acyltransferase [Aliidiomarina iranensis]|uniref:Apolipoprotein N-acyltransferase n=1 Tax=Aliidiomarina iranensis TaxID=1434071 RepID=A0A432VX87_9GAMM|nr:apolipoprotein N-acyltransferase [Aliidiomarina iranensis]RUO21208.1 apolipoprotein N-acyltransferase [Aliidiomarina iranensis]